MANDCYPDNVDCAAAMLQQKQLPLRQQRDKPVLKYSGHGNSYLTPPTFGASSFVRGPADDVVHAKQALSTEMLTTYMNGASGVSHCVYPSQFMPRSSQVPFTSYMFNSASSANGVAVGLTPAQILSANIAKYNNASVSVNPYMRPFSACDIQPQDGHTGHGVVTNMATLARTTSSGCIDAKKIKSNDSSARQTIQTNAFMRPRSATKSEGDRCANESNRVKVPGSVAHVSVANHVMMHIARDRGYVSGDGLFVKPPHDNGTEPTRNGKIPHGCELGIRITDSHHAMVDVAKTVSTSQTTESLPLYANKIMPRPPTIDKCRQKVDKPVEAPGCKALSATTSAMKRVGNVYSMATKNSPEVYRRAPATATMAVYRLHTGSNAAAANATGKGGTQHSVENVPVMTGTAIHNPNYTPAKPYSELSSTSSSSMTSGSGRLRLYLNNLICKFKYFNESAFEMINNYFLYT